MKYKNGTTITFLFIIMGVFLSACTTTLALYRYASYPEKGFSNSYKDVLSIRASVINIDTENSPVSAIRIYDREYDFAEIIAPSIKVVDIFGKEYILKVNEQYRYAVNIHEQGVILQGEFKAYIGKVRRKDGTILNLPPLIFKEYVNINKFNPIMGSMNINTKEKVFSGTVEDYEKERNKTKTKK